MGPRGMSHGLVTGNNKATGNHKATGNNNETKDNNETGGDNEIERKASLAEGMKSGDANKPATIALKTKIITSMQKY